MSKNRGFAHPEIILVVILMFVIGAGAFFLSKNSPISLVSQSSPTPEANEMTDWETYTTKKHGFQFKYPKDWNIQETDISLEEVQEIYPNASAPIVEIKKDNTTYISLELSKSLALESEFPSYIESINNQYDYDFQAYELNNIKGYRKEFEVEGQKVVNFLFYKNGNVVSLTWSMPINFVDSSLFDQILSTFEFTDSTEAFEGKFCGGIAAIPCPTGYNCVLDGNYPDAGGKCQKN